MSSVGCFIKLLGWVFRYSSKFPPPTIKVNKIWQVDLVIANFLSFIFKNYWILIYALNCNYLINRITNHLKLLRKQNQIFLCFKRNVLTNLPKVQAYKWLFCHANIFLTAVELCTFYRTFSFYSIYQDFLISQTGLFILSYYRLVV